MFINCLTGEAASILCMTAIGRFPGLRTDFAFEYQGLDAPSAVPTGGHVAYWSDTFQRHKVSAGIMIEHFVNRQGVVK